MSKNNISNNIVRIRLSKDKTQKQVADDAEISLLAYRNIEAGEAEPKSYTLERIAKALEVNVSELFMDYKELTSVRFRAHAKKIMKKRQQILYVVSNWLNNFDTVEKKLTEIEDKLSIKVKKDILDDFSIPSNIENKPIYAAQLVRKKLNLGDEPIRNICALLESSLGIKVYAKTFNSDSFFGLAVNDEEYGTAIIINTWDRIPIERRIFSAAHELGHLILHNNASSFDLEKKEEDELEEKEANTFASHFLMPKELFEKEWNKLSGDDLVERVLKTKKIFNVSYKVILYRLQDYFPGNIWQLFYSEYNKNYPKSLSFKEEIDPLGENGPEPDALSGNYYFGNRLSRLLKEAYKNKLIIDDNEIARILEIKISDVPKLKDSWENYDIAV